GSSVSGNSFRSGSSAWEDLSAGFRQRGLEIFCSPGILATVASMPARRVGPEPTPTEQPPRKLSGTRTVLARQSGERRSWRPPKGKPQAQGRRSRSQVPEQMGCGGHKAATTPSRRYNMSHIAILGAGITGVTSAYLLARAGHKVTVLEREHYAAMETSYANGGQLSASNAEVWNKPS